ncbi:hypothetical protein [Intestinimonas sp. HCP28S3_D6]|uniref:hypothetical protein n=1 Tax=Intestinimonas sp. HCP28S3_D6 TaxID=3438942 RepID=UPI003F8AC194
MTATTEEKSKNSPELNEEDLEYKIEIATQTLDRNIGFVTNCDNKTSIVLAAFGVLLAIILTNEGLNEIFTIVKACIASKTFCSILYLLCFAGAIFSMVLGMFNLGSVLVAKTSEEAIGRKDENSRIFFAGIRKNGNYNTYQQKFCAMSKEDFLNDLIEQIYINADIASIKYATYNRGLRRTIVGFIFFVVLLLIGIYIY